MMYLTQRLRGRALDPGTARRRSGDLRERPASLAPRDDVLDLSRWRRLVCPWPRRRWPWRPWCAIAQRRRGAAARPGLYLRVEMPESIPSLCADPTRIRQVLLNLLTNAARFTESGGIYRAGTGAGGRGTGVGGGHGGGHPRRAAPGYLRRVPPGGYVPASALRGTGWGWPSAASLSLCMTAASGRKAKSGRGASSTSPCPCPRRPW